MTPEKFQEFILKSGLKKRFICENVIKAPVWIITKWLSGDLYLYPRQQEALDDFVDQYYKNNPHMQE